MNLHSISPTLEVLTEALSDCDLCPRDCHVDRHREVGFCGLGADAWCYKDFIHHGEEQGLTPSYTIFLSGCNQRCAFCSEVEWNLDPIDGRQLSTYPDGERIAEMMTRSPVNLHFVGGEPVVNLPAVFSFLQANRHQLAGLPVVFNTNLYVSSRYLDAVSLFDVVIADLKFGSDDCALALCGAPDYVETVMASLRYLLTTPGGPRIIVRHLLLPEHFNCCTLPALTHLRETGGEYTLNVMTGYLPLTGDPSAPSSPLSGREAAMMIERIRGLGFTDLLVDGRR